MPHKDTRKSLQHERRPPPSQPRWCPHVSHPTSKTVRSRFCDLQYFLFVQTLNRVQLFATPWAAEHQSSLSFTIFQSLLKFMSTESVMLSNHLILCHPLLLLFIVWLVVYFALPASRTKTSSQHPPKNPCLPCPGDCSRCLNERQVLVLTELLL